jgi:hypothetical protein
LAGAVEALAAGGEIDPGELEAALGLMQGIDSLEAFQILGARAVPAVTRIFDGGLGTIRADLLMFVLKVLGLYQSEEAAARVARVAREEGWRDHPLWPVFFATFESPHPRRRQLAEALREPLPGGRAGAAFLEFATGMARGGELVFHPFDSDQGRAMLREWLGPGAGDDRAVPAAAALAHVGGPDRDELLKSAMGHGSSRVRLEAAYAAARLGRDEGVARLAALSLDVARSVAAREYLEELGRGDAVPMAAREPNFEAAAHLVDWLAHPLEYGRPPDELEALDSRELLWPPVNDLRRVWLFRYKYRELEPAGDHGDRPPAEGVGMVGSITAALHGQTGPGMDPVDLYALHCCWELMVEGDPRAPGGLSVEEGRRLLGLGARKG